MRDKDQIVYTKPSQLHRDEDACCLDVDTGSTGSVGQVVSMNYTDISRGIFAIEIEL
jgi:hypothetical protein